MRSIDCPVLFVHGPDDEQIPFSHGLELFNAAPDPKQFLKISGDHDSGFLNNRGLYLSGIGSFLNQVGFESPKEE